MQDMQSGALVDTTRDELRERIAQARDRFNQLIRTADPQARPAGSDWTVHQVTAHVLTVAHRYRQSARGLEYHRAVNPADMALINQVELEAAMAPVPDLADELRSLEAEMDGWFDRIHNDRPEYLFHGGVLVSGITGQTNWLAELLVHGLDIARAVRAPWELSERDMLLVMRGMMQIGPAFLRADVSPDTDICVAVKVPEARPYVVHVHHGTAEMRELGTGDRPDAVLRAPASTLQLMFYGRIGHTTAMRRGLRIVGGRRPWKALKLTSCFATG